MGVDPLMKSLLYMYVSECYGAEGLNAEQIRMPDSAVCDGEHIYPFPNSAINVEELCVLPKESKEAYSLDPAAFDAEGVLS